MESSTKFSLPPLPHLDVALNRLIERYSQFETPPKFLEAANLSKEIVGQGKHQELLETCEVYQQLYERQLFAAPV